MPKRGGIGKECVLRPNCAGDAVETARALARTWELDICVEIGRGTRILSRESERSDEK